MNKDRIKYLLSKPPHTPYTDDELLELDIWYKSFNSEPEFTKYLNEEELTGKRDLLWNRIQDQKKLRYQQNHNIFTTLLNSTYLKVAVALIMVSSIAFFLIKYDAEKLPTDSKKYAILDDVQSGGNRATLTFSDGKTIDLNSINAGEVIQRPGLLVTKTKDGLLTYTATKSSETTLSNSYNIISTPMGGQYKITLSDGTNVWLNAGSSLEYPERFASHERSVKLNGEAYFEVAKQTYLANNKEIRKPFFVNTKDQEIEVLGTHFNVKAYQEDQITKTTLLEGKVKVTGYIDGQKTNQQTILEEGQAAVWDTNSLTTKYVNPELDIAWKNGKFIFSGENIKTLMTNISRWYNVEVVFEGNLSDINFEGSVSRYETIAEVLRKLALTETVNFKIVPIKNELGQERRIIIMP